MKRLLLTASIVIGASSASAASQPNLFRCQDADGKYEVSYTSTSYSGEPTMIVSINGESVYTPGRTNVRLSREDTSFGTLATLVVERIGLMDAPFLQYGVFIPHFVGDISESAEFSTQLLVGNTGGMIRSGPNQRIQKAINLVCSATKVFF